MKIAYTMAPGKGDTDLILEALASTLLERGFSACGTVQINSERDDCPKCDMDVRVLPDGPVIRISQALGKESKGCRLDPAALEQSVGIVEQRIEAGADILIVNKFGKHEAEGRGFRNPIALALEKDMPVLVGLNRLNKEAFLEFVGGEAQEVAPNADSLIEWAEEAVEAEGADA